MDQSVLFEVLFTRLRAEGFALGYDHHLRLYQLLHHVKCQPAELRTILCPLFATNRWQQRRFLEIFDECYPQFTPPSTSTPSKSRKWLWFLIGLLLFIVALAVVIPLLAPPSKEISLKDILVAPPSPPPPPPSEVQRSYRHRVINLASLPTPPQRPFNWLLILFPVASIAYWLWTQRTSRKMIIERTQGLPPPHYWPLRITRSGTSIYPQSEITLLSQLMRRRTVEGFSVLDVPATIRATIRSAGYTQIRHRFLRRIPDYLVLIERRANNDHFAHLIDDLFELLSAEGVFVERYFFEGDTRSLVSPSGKLVRLENLAGRTASHRLLVFGDSRTFVHPITGKVEPWSEHLWSNWEHRAALLSDAPPRRRIDQLCDAGYTLVPASTAGLRQLLNYWDAGGGRQALIPPVFRPLPEPFDKNETWVKACAIYPELNWNLSLHMAPHPYNETTVSRLARAPWFRDGILPLPTRERMRASLPAELRPMLMGKLQALLEGQPPPEGSHAHAVWQATLKLFDPTRGGGHASDLLEDVTLLRFLREDEPQSETLTERKFKIPAWQVALVCSTALAMSFGLYKLFPPSPPPPRIDTVNAFFEDGTAAVDVELERPGQGFVNVKTPHPLWTKSWSLTGNSLRVVVGKGRPLDAPFSIDRWGSGYTFNSPGQPIDINIEYSGRASSIEVAPDYKASLPLTAPLNWVEETPDGLMLHLRPQAPTTYKWKLTPQDPSTAIGLNPNCCTTEIKRNLNPSPEVPPPSAITSFRVSPTSLTAPGTVNVLWSSKLTNGDTLYLDSAGRSMPLSESGQRTVNVNATQKLVLFIQSTDGKRKGQRTQTVTLESGRPLVLLLVSCSDSALAKENLTLTYGSASIRVPLAGCENSPTLNLPLGPAPTGPFTVTIRSGNSKQSPAQQFNLDPAAVSRSGYMTFTYRVADETSYNVAQVQQSKAPNEIRFSLVIQSRARATAN